jgi:hypothetical protein
MCLGVKDPIQTKEFISIAVFAKTYSYSPDKLPRNSMKYYPGLTSKIMSLMFAITLDELINKILIGFWVP